MKRILAILAIAMLSACAGQIVVDPTTGAKTVDISAGKMEVATHNDLLAAARYAEDHGFPARAAVWRAHDAHLTAVEAQISACANAINADLKAKLGGAGAGAASPFLAVEMAAEAVGTATGPSPAVKLNCAPLPIVTLPGLPRLP